MSDTDRRDGDPVDPVQTGETPPDPAAALAGYTGAAPSAGPDPLGAEAAEPPSPPPPPGATVTGSSTSDEDKLMVILTHAANIVGVFTGGIGNIVAIILAFVKKDTAPAWARSHYVFAIRTVVIALIACIALLVLMGVLIISIIGWIALPVLPLFWLALGAWIGVRSVVALLKANRQQPYPNPETWMV